MFLNPLKVPIFSRGNICVKCPGEVSVNDPVTKEATILDKMKIAVQKRIAHFL